MENILSYTIYNYTNPLGNYFTPLGIQLRTPFPYVFVVVSSQRASVAHLGYLHESCMQHRIIEKTLHIVNVAQGIPVAGYQGLVRPWVVGGTRGRPKKHYENAVLTRSEVWHVTKLSIF